MIIDMEKPMFRRLLKSFYRLGKTDKSEEDLAFQIDRVIKKYEVDRK